jgi:hypothetical protein
MVRVTEASHSERCPWVSVKAILKGMGHCEAIAEVQAAMQQGRTVVLDGVTFEPVGRSR